MTIPALRVEVAKSEVRRTPTEVPAHVECRLVVLVPTQDIDAAGLARHIWDLAAPSGWAVLFLGLCPNPEEEWRLRRHLVTLAAVTRDLRVPVEVGIEYGRSWTRAVGRVWRIGDRVVCHAEQSVGLPRRPLAEILRGELRGPVDVLTGFYAPPPRAGGGMRAVAHWVTPVAVVVGVFFLQVFLPRLSTETTRQVLVYVSLSVGLGLIWLWSRSLS